MKKNEQEVGTVRYEEAAERVAIEAWVCKTCQSVYLEAEHTARWCCATDLPCTRCGGRRGKRRGYCDACCTAIDDAKWASRERSDWAEEPLYSETLERFLMDADEVQDALDEHGGDPEALRLVICEPVYASEVDDDYWCDELPEDARLEDVNEPIAEALEHLNSVIRQQRNDGRQISWQRGRFAAVVALPIFRDRSSDSRL